jgi:hypothetical protein
VAQDYIDKADQIDLASLNEANEEYNRRLASFGKTAVGTWGSSALAYQALKYTPIGPAIGKKAAKLSTVVNTWYAPGNTRNDKIALLYNHFKNNEVDEILKIQKMSPHFGNLDDPKKLVYNIKRNMDNWGIRTYAEQRALIERDRYARNAVAMRGSASSHKYTTLSRNLRHERLAQEMIDWTEKGTLNVERLEKNGLSKPKLTDMKNAFGSGNNFDDHAGVMKRWGSGLTPDTKISTSKILDVGGDLKAITGSATRDAQYQMAEYVTRFADLSNPDDIKSKAYERIYGMKNSKNLRTAKWNTLHKNVTDIDKEVTQFLQNFTVNKKGGFTNINFSPQFKPHYLAGGVNASVNMKLSRYNNIQRNILISDKYDVILENDPFQRKVHFNVTGTRDIKRVPRSIKFSNELKAKNWKKAFNQGAKLAMKGAKTLGRIALFKRI